MKAAYYLTIPNAPMSKFDAVVTEVETLGALVTTQSRVYLYPTRKPGTRIPRIFWGFSSLFNLLKLDNEVDFHHIFNPDPFWFPVLTILKKPIIYTSVTGIRDVNKNQVSFLAKRVNMLVVPTENEKNNLFSWGIKNVTCVPIGINTSNFNFSPVSKKQPITIMMGSAPWTLEQFKSKGVDALIEATKINPNLNLIFLWRNVLEKEIKERIVQENLADQIHLITERVDVNSILAKSHASVVMAESSLLVKAFPHSLLESLVAGKPILVSRTLPIADYVTENQCGVVIPNVTAEDFLDSLTKLLEKYDFYQQQAKIVGARDFGQSNFLSGYQAIYNEMLADQSISL